MDIALGKVEVIGIGGVNMRHPILIPDDFDPVSQTGDGNRAIGLRKGPPCERTPPKKQHQCQYNQDTGSDR